MIPKVIHYCWFGGKPIPTNLNNYIETWKKHCPNYEFKLWNEDSFDVNSHCFTKSAYEYKKYAFVSDYVRVYALHYYGGIYLDTDVEIKKNIDEFLTHEAFTGFEAKGSPFTALWGSIPKHSLTKKMLNYYDGKIFTPSQTPNTLTVSNILVKDFKIDPDKNHLQIGDDNTNKIHIYPAEYFCLDISPNYTTHHFSGSWINKNTSEKRYIHNIYYTDKLFEEANSSSTIKAIAFRISFKDMLKMFILNVYFKLVPKQIKKLLKLRKNIFNKHKIKNL
ncbi:MAG TPA: glycosyl transferase [Crocinitomix sp.]|nr:glycosyl transferase [Crocinitomix sp.]